MYSDHDPPTNRRGLPHSDISGSKLVWQLPEAFRSLLRPSSLIRVKASTIYVSNLLLQCILLILSSADLLLLTGKFQRTIGLQRINPEWISSPHILAFYLTSLCWNTLTPHGFRATGKFLSTILSSCKSETENRNESSDNSDILVSDPTKPWIRLGWETKKLFSQKRLIYNSRGKKPVNPRPFSPWNGWHPSGIRKTKSDVIFKNRAI